MRDPETDANAVEWICTECGRSHPRHSPPCSRCGHTTLVSREVEGTDVEVGAPGYRDLLDAKHVLAFAVAVGLLALLGLGAAGVVDLPGAGPPTVENVPGNATGTAGLDFGTVESAVVARLDRRHDAAVERDPTLDSIAAYYTKSVVKASANGRDPPTVGDAIERFEYSCSGRLLVLDPAPVAASTYGGNETAIATAVTDGVAGELSSRSRVAVGIDLHAAPDGTVHLTVLVC